MVLASIWPTTVEGWVALITVICTAIGAIAALVPTVIKLVKSLGEIAKNKNWKKILVIISKTVVEAEKTAKSGAEKKEIVVNAVKTFCVEAGVEWTAELAKQVSDAIDDVIAVHNQLSGK